jgi:peptidoglycan/xylan/chitin deacetylase (PgdA/CDA1 family)
MDNLMPDNFDKNSRKFGATRMVVLMYHRIGEAHNTWERKYCVSPERFATQMRLLAKQGFQAVTIDDFVLWIGGKRELPDNSFLITFDDGFFGVYEHALPVLRELGWPATVFLVSGLIGARDDWCRTENPSGHSYPLLGMREIEVMVKSGFSFHSHTRHHKRLPTLSDIELHDQVEGSRRELADLLGTPVDYLAYPYGLVNARVIQATRTAGYSAAFSVQPGFNRCDVDHYRIRRLDIFGTDTPSMLMRKVHLGDNDGTLLHASAYYLERLASRLPGRKS